MNPWRSIWLQPRATIRSIVSENPNRSLWLLASIYGFSSILNSFQSIEIGGKAALFMLMSFAIIFAPLWGYVIFSIWGWLVSFTGKWLQGKGDFALVRAAYAWSCVPLTVNVVLWWLLVFLMGNQIFRNYVDGYLLSQTQISLLFLLLIAKMVFVIWSIIIYLNALAEVQKFSVLRAICNVLIAAVIAGILLAVFYSLIVGLFHMKEVSL